MYEWKKMKQKLRTTFDNNFVFPYQNTNLNRQEQLMKNAKEWMSLTAAVDSIAPSWASKKGKSSSLHSSRKLLFDGRF